MASEHEYTIRIKKEYSSSGNVESNQTAGTGEKKPSVVEAVNGNNNKSSTASVGVKVMAVSIGKSYIKYGLSNVGKWTGNSKYQSMVNNTTEVIGLGILAFANPFAAVAAVAIKAGTTFINGKFDEYLEGVKSTRALNRAGYSSIDEIIGVKH